MLNMGSLPPNINVLVGGIQGENNFAQRINLSWAGSPTVQNMGPSLF